MLIYWCISLLTSNVGSFELTVGSNILNLFNPKEHEGFCNGSSHRGTKPNFAPKGLSIVLRVQRITI